MTTFDKIFRAIERITGQHIVCFHDKANRYAFKTFQGEWKTIDRDFVHDFAGI